MMPIPKVAPSILFPRFSPRSFDSRIALAHKLAVESAKEDFAKRPNDHLIGRFEVRVVDKKGKVLGIGKSPVADLFTNNFGNILGSIFAWPGTGGVPILSLKDITNAAVTAYSWYANYSWFGNGSYAVGLQLGVGSNATAPARTDYNMGTLLGAWTNVTNSTDLYSASTFQIITTCSITLASGGSVVEAGAAFVLYNSIGGTKTVMIAHDAISPTVVVPAGAAAIPSWTVQT
jgi:hypothetical protein